VDQIIAALTRIESVDVIVRFTGCLLSVLHARAFLARSLVMICLLVSFGLYTYRLLNNYCSIKLIIVLNYGH